MKKIIALALSSLFLIIACEAKQMDEFKTMDASVNEINKTYGLLKASGVDLMKHKANKQEVIGKLNSGSAQAVDKYLTTFVQQADSVLAKKAKGEIECLECPSIEIMRTHALEYQPLAKQQIEKAKQDEANQSNDVPKDQKVNTSEAKYKSLLKASKELRIEQSKLLKEIETQFKIDLSEESGTPQETLDALSYKNINLLWEKTASYLVVLDKIEIKLKEMKANKKSDKKQDMEIDDSIKALAEAKELANKSYQTIYQELNSRLEFKADPSKIQSDNEYKDVDGEVLEI